jgi:hypothetical protein
MLLKRVMGLVVLAFGLFGVIACMAGVYAVRSLGSRLEGTNDKVFAMIDNGLAAAQDQIRAVQMRVKKSKITTTEIGQGVRDLATRRAKEGIVTRLEIESGAEKLAAYLETADAWLETSAESIRSSQQVLELGNSMGTPLDLASLEEVLENITSLRSTLHQAERTVSGILEFAASTEGELEEDRLSRATTLLGRILMALGEIDTRLQGPVTRLPELQADASRLKTRISNRILLATIGGYLVLAWIAAGQAALCVGGWKKSRRRFSAAELGRPLLPDTA